MTLKQRDDHATTRQVLADLDRDRPTEGPCVRCGVATTRADMDHVTAPRTAAFAWTRVFRCLVCVVGRHWLDVLDYRAAHPEDLVVRQVWDAQRVFGLPDDAAQRATAERLVERLEVARGMYQTAVAKDVAIEAVLWPAVSAVAA